jgi:hypothetical protein
MATDPMIEWDSGVGWLLIMVVSPWVEPPLQKTAKIMSSQ